MTSDSIFNSFDRKLLSRKLRSLKDVSVLFEIYLQGIDYLEQEGLLFRMILASFLRVRAFGSVRKYTRKCLFSRCNSCIKKIATMNLTLKLRPSRTP